MLCLVRSCGKRALRTLPHSSSSFPHPVVSESADNWPWSAIYFIKCLELKLMQPIGQPRLLVLASCFRCLAYLTHYRSRRKVLSYNYITSSLPEVLAAYLTACASKSFSRYIWCLQFFLLVNLIENNFFTWWKAPYYEHALLLHDILPPPDETSTGA